MTGIFGRRQGAEGRDGYEYGIRKKPKRKEGVPSFIRAS
jgi:hypothetical protein